ncbi:alpha/beta hydrolase [Sphingobium scionense]|nr:alpha/beta hydrolase [Sphingobium scionense]
MRARFCLASLLALSAAATHAEQAQPRFTPDGTVQVPAFDLPPSELASEEARAMQRQRGVRPAAPPRQQEPDIAARRAQLDAMMAPQVQAMRTRYPVDIAEDVIAGVPVRIFTPKGAKADPARVLINLHGGAFTMCWDSCSVLESAPIAALGGYKVVSVNYRMAPEQAHPAGVEDAASVYAALLKHYRPQRIGVFGCSAGGALTAQLAAWLPAHHLPQAGAIGIFGAGAVRMESGDSAWIAAAIDGSFPAPARPGEAAIDMTRGYFKAADMGDAIISPALHPDVLAHFPPTLLITGTRAMDMSPAVYTNSQLLKAGRRSTLIVGEAMGHCYSYMADLPEARDAHAASIAFFREHLK